MTTPRITRRQIRAELIVRRDALAARRAGIDAVAARAPYSYATFKAAQRAGTLVELLGSLDSHTLRCQAVRLCVEAPHLGEGDVDRVEAALVRLLSEARFGRKG